MCPEGPEVARLGAGAGEGGTAVLPSPVWGQAELSTPTVLSPHSPKARVLGHRDGVQPCPLQNFVSREGSAAQASALQHHQWVPWL